MTLQFSEFYNSYSKNSLENGDKIFFKPNIPPKKLANAIKAYAPHVSEEDVYILADETFWGKADNGLLVTNTEIITNDPSDKIYNIKLDNVGGFTFGGILGGNFILNGHKLIVFTQLLKNDKNKLSACLNAFLEKKARVEQAIVIQKKEEEKEQLIEKLDSVLLSEIISSRDKNLIGTFIEANDLTPLKRIKATIHDRPDLFLNNENGLGFRRILERTSIDSSAVKNVIELMYEVFSLAEILDELQKNEVFEILMVQNKVIATIFIAMKTITCGYLKTILDYMPSERSLEIVQRYESAFNIIISQLLMAIALNKNLGEVLQTMAKVLKEGKNIVIFPEGARTRDGEMLEFKKAFAILAKEMEVDIVPFGIRGAYEAFPANSKLPKPAQVEIKYFEPISSKDKSYEEIVQETRDTLIKWVGK